MTIEVKDLQIEGIIKQSRAESDRVNALHAKQEDDRQKQFDRNIEAINGEAFGPITGILVFNGTLDSAFSKLSRDKKIKRLKKDGWVEFKPGRWKKISPSDQVSDPGYLR